MKSISCWLSLTLRPAVNINSTIIHSRVDSRVRIWFFNEFEVDFNFHITSSRFFHQYTFIYNTSPPLPLSHSRPIYKPASYKMWRVKRCDVVKVGTRKKLLLRVEYKKSAFFISLRTHIYIWVWDGHDGKINFMVGLKKNII